MTGTDVMMLVRQRANDLDRTRYSDFEILNNINSAIRQLSQILIKRSAPEMIATLNVTTSVAVPAGFHSFVGQFPVWREGDQLHTAQTGAVTVRYFKYKDPLVSLADTIPFDDNYVDSIVYAALILLFNTDESSVNVESALLSAFAINLPKPKQRKDEEDSSDTSSKTSSSS